MPRKRKGADLSAVQAKLEIEIADPKEQKNKSSNKILDACQNDAIASRRAEEYEMNAMNWDVSGKVQLPEIETPPEPLNGLLIGTDPDSNVFLKRIVSELDALLNEHNELLKIFKSHMHQLQSDNHAIVINPDKTPAGEYS
ncbi:hypothetical protein EVAR_100129_1 [Eumeta japonica]|uniref:Uncharacterized protein n=1 Tax=Eumeta variegata TaxID=151549 RepID=A0A4C1ZNT6_EUMVA|nr:hypothetical protein EVAR_100129_1 [Eumeta japonica]